MLRGVDRRRVVLTYTGQMLGPTRQGLGPGRGEGGGGWGGRGPSAATTDTVVVGVAVTANVPTENISMQATRVKMKAFFTVHPFNGVIDFDRKIVAMTALGFYSKVTIPIENEIAKPKRERAGTPSPHNPTT